MYPKLRLKPGKDRALRSGHPWIFSGAFQNLDAGLEPGTIVDVETAAGELVGRGYANPRCAIAVRLLTRREEPIDADFVRHRIARALGWRRACVGEATNAYRLLNGEGDGLPGVIADVYGDFVVLQILTAGAERLRDFLMESLREEISPRGIFERSAGNVRREEGLAQVEGVAYGEAPPNRLEIREHGHVFLVDLRAGQKTGFYLDQRPNRLLAQQLAGGRRVLNAFGYTGSFAVYAARGGATEVVSVESSARALELAELHRERNGLAPGVAAFVEADVFEYLRRGEDLFDLLILDPPALVKHRAHVQRGARAYKDLNLQALRRAAAGALLMTFTCSQHVDAELFRKIVLGAAADAGRRLQLLQALGPGWDHPSELAHPEGEYLRGLLLRAE